MGIWSRRFLCPLSSPLLLPAGQSIGKRAVRFPGKITVWCREDFISLVDIGPRHHELSTSIKAARLWAMYDQGWRVWWQVCRLLTYGLRQSTVRWVSTINWQTQIHQTFYQNFEVYTYDVKDSFSKGHAICALMTGEIWMLMLACHYCMIICPICNIRCID